MNEQRFGPVLFIPGLNKGRYPYCNSMYIEGPGVLIDPSSDRDRLIRLIEEQGVKEVWLTHWHEDHIMYLDLFEGVPLRMSDLDADRLSSIDSFMDWDWYEGTDDERRWWAAMLENMVKFKPKKPSGYLRGGDIADKNGVRIEIISSPGHTPGSLSFFIKDPGVLITGDYDLTAIGPYYGDRDSSIQDTSSTISRLRAVLAGIVLTGHEHGIFNNPADDIWNRYADVLDKREQKLLELLQTPKTLREIIDAHIMYGKPREPKSFYDLGERAVMKKHLEFLLEKKMIMFDGDAYRCI